MHKPSASEQAVGFGSSFEWDIDLYSGYNSKFLKNVSKKPTVNKFWGCNTPSIKSEIQNQNFDGFILTGWNLFSYMQALLACKYFDTPIFIRGDSQLESYRSKIKKIVKYIPYIILIRAFDGYLIVGQRAKKYFQHFGASQNNMYWVPHCVDNKFFESGSNLTQNAIEQVKNSLGISIGSFVLIFVGKFTDIKRPLDLIYAANLLLKKGFKLECLFVGSGALTNDIISYSTSLNVKSHMVGFQNQSRLPIYYGISDMLILPSESETWGLVINEAMACGLPVIVSNGVGCKDDLIIDEITGKNFPVGNIELLANAIEYLITKLENDNLKPGIKNKIDSYSIEIAVDGILSAVNEKKKRSYSK